MNYRIFLVEDDRSIADGLRHQLEQWDFTVQVVQNFRGVLGEFTAFDPHLVLMDIMLPCYDGYHWCREIRQVSQVPIIFLSSASDNMNLRFFCKCWGRRKQRSFGKNQMRTAL